MTKIVTNLFCEDKKKNFWIGFCIILFFVITVSFLWWKGVDQRSKWTQDDWEKYNSAQDNPNPNDDPQLGGQNPATE